MPEFLHIKRLLINAKGPSIYVNFEISHLVHGYFSAGWASAAKRNHEVGFTLNHPDKDDFLIGKSSHHFNASSHHHCFPGWESREYGLLPGKYTLKIKPLTNGLIIDIHDFWNVNFHWINEVEFDDGIKILKTSEEGSKDDKVPMRWDSYKIYQMAKRSRRSA